MYPHERSLVKRWKSKPFVILGVNSDPPERLRARIKDGTVTWTCFSDGGDADGPIARRWNISAWPTVYVLDDRGVVRYRNLQDDSEIDQCVNKLIAEVHSGSRKLK
jgi:hypothetical protein